MGNIVTTADLAGEAIAGEADRLNELIDWAEQWIERETGFRFHEHHAEFVLDGKRDPVLILPQAIISIQSVAEDGASLSSGDYAVYNRRPPDMDDRGFPRLVRKTSATGFDDSGRQRHDINWALGHQNIVVEGQFGYTETVGDQKVAPYDVKRAILRLVAAEIKRVGDTADVQEQRAMKWATSITSDSLSISLAELAGKGGKSGLIEVDLIVDRYRHPVTAKRAPFAFGGG